MALMTPEQFEESLKKIKPRVFMNGKLVEDILAEMLGTCIYRCVGYDSFHSLYATTWEMDKELGTEYHPRFLEYLKMVQKNDLSVAGALTESRGSRKENPLNGRIHISP